MHRLPIVALAAVCVLVASGTAYGGGPLQTAVYVQATQVPSSDVAANAFFKRIRQTGATAVRLTVSWKQIAPAQRDDGFHAGNPADTAYDWAFTDREIKLAFANGLTPLVDVLTAPPWAESGGSGQGNMRVSASALGQFATAITTRYSGSFQGLPRVRYWLVWNEPNLSTYLAPQVAGKQLVGADRYRGMVNAFASAAHAVRPDNVVVAGLTSPFTFKNDPGPLKFMRRVLCMSAGAHPRLTCSARTQFDVWAVHPYTSGGPTHHAFNPNDVSLGDLPKVRGLLSAATRAHHVVSRGAPGFWVTEFSWDSKPPDRKGVPAQLEARWVAQALYQAWKSGVGLFTWLLLTDELHPSPFQSGLYFHSGKPKPALTAFRFPFVAFKRGSGVLVWGRTPTSKSAGLSIELSSGKGWRTVATLRANENGIFSSVLRIHAPSSASMRAVGADGTSLSFPLTPPPDMFVTPFGS